MSGPVTEADAPADTLERGVPEPPCLEVTESHQATVGRFTVRRALPRRGRRTVGAWCFADHMGPADVTENAGLDVGPHPHVGLQTVTWLLDGQALHRDSLGSEQVIAPGQLNLMTSGHGITHSEEATGHYRGTLEGIQLWVALPDGTRGGAGGFDHHAELPRAELDGAVATVFLGQHGALRSPARTDTPLVGMELDVHGPVTLPLEPGWEHALVVLEGALGIAGRRLDPGHLGYLGEGRQELALDVRERTRAVLIGGEPFEEPLLMWWNFVARTRDEVEAAYLSWAAGDDRFGRVASRLDPIPARPPFWMRTNDSRGDR